MTTVEHPRCECHDCTQSRRFQHAGILRYCTADTETAVLTERERCAKLAESFIDRDQTTGWTAAARIAGEIREGVLAKAAQLIREGK